MEVSVKAARQRDGMVRILARFRNHDLGLTGIPDVVSVEKGQLIPIEIKSHRELRPSDELELAFYYRLLSPAQAGDKRRRKGYVWLSTGERRMVPLGRPLFEQLDRLVADVRTAKNDGTDPARVQECYSCRLREEHFQVINKLGDVSLIYDIGSQRRERLRQLGMNNVSDLAAADIVDLHSRWRRIDRYTPSLKQLRNMQAHGEAWLTGRPQVVGTDPVPDNKRALILDLEYETWLGRYAFVVGVLAVEDGKETALYQEFAESVADEKRIMTKLAKLLKAFPDHKVAAWNGTAADLVEIDNAWRRLGLRGNCPDKEVSSKSV